MHPSDLQFLGSIHPKFNELGVCDSDLHINSNRKVGKCGIALVWKNELNHIISPLLTPRGSAASVWDRF